MVAVYVFIGGGVGSVLRWAVAQGVEQPWATLVVNVVGSFLLAYLAHPGVLSDGPWKVALCTGVMGGFTTYSTFNLEVLKLLQEGRTGAAVLQIALTVGIALAAGLAGWSVGGWRS